MNKIALIITGGPREDGISSQMAICLINSLQKQGWDCRVATPYKLNLSPCLVCKKCRVTGICPINDGFDMQRELFLTSSLIAISAPTYFANIPGPLKNMLDRMNGVILDERAKPKLKDRKGYVLMTSCTTPPPFDRLFRQSSGALRAMNEFFKMAGMACKGKIVYPGAVGNAPLPTNIQRKIERIWV